MSPLKNLHIIFTVLFFVFGICGIAKCQSDGAVAKIENGNIIVKFNDMMHSKVISKKAEVPLMYHFQPSEYISINGADIKKFKIIKHSFDHFTDSLGMGTKLVLVGNSANEKYSIQKRLVVKAYDEFPDLVITQASYTNIGDKSFKINKWVNNSYQIASQFPKDTSKIAFWSYQSGTYPTRNDWVRPVKDGFSQENYMGMNSSDYGGGTPVVDIWRRDVGVAIGHISTVPQLVSLPVNAPDISEGVHVAVEYDYSNISKQKMPHEIHSGQTLSTLKTFVTVHTGDFFQALSEYSDLMKARGMSFPKWPAGSYQPVWCAWGYGRGMNLQQVLNTLPTVKKLGFEWVVLDDGWQKAEGNWTPNSKFHEISMKEFVQKIHDAGMKAKLWWAPMSADSGSKVFEKHPEWLIINKKGDLQHITWWDSYYLNPADPEVIAHTKKLVNKFINEWGFDGLKIDGQFLNQVPPDYSPFGNLKYPEESVEELPGYFNMIYQTATKLNKNAVVEICPCGAAVSYHIMTAMNQPVASDPKDSWQVRHRGKVYKALMGPRVPYYGDHVELSNNGIDFASTIGIGGVPGSKFTIQQEAPKGSYGYKYRLTPSKKKRFKKWLSIYEKHMLSKGKYLGQLYDIGFGRPGAHTIRKDGNMYYAFYTKKKYGTTYSGTIHLKGLKKGVKYRVIDYENDKNYGVVKGPEASFKVDFKRNLLLKAIPVSSD